MASDRPASERSRWRAPSKVKTPSRMRLEYGASGYEPARGHLAAGQSVSASGTIQSSPSVDRPVRRPPAAGANSAVWPAQVMRTRSLASSWVSSLGKSGMKGSGGGSVPPRQ